MNMYVCSTCIHQREHALRTHMNKAGRWSCCVRDVSMYVRDNMSERILKYEAGPGNGSCSLAWGSCRSGDCQ